MADLIKKQSSSLATQQFRFVICLIGDPMGIIQFLPAGLAAALAVQIQIGVMRHAYEPGLKRAVTLVAVQLLEHPQEHVLRGVESSVMLMRISEADLVDQSFVFLHQQLEGSMGSAQDSVDQRLIIELHGLLPEIPWPMPVPMVFAPLRLIDEIHREMVSKKIALAMLFYTKGAASRG
jgi:hypothetical protein